MKKSLFLVLVLFLISSTIYSQKPQKLSSNQIYEKIQKLNFLGKALYVAAHPDDENTRLIAYLANHVKARTAYLSLTRGDGGQNLIGPEIRELLGVIRTQELLAARRVDGGEQRFSRANDFGFSKHPKETFNIWDKDEVMADVVWAIRTFKPDVIINRFDHRTPGTTHGHHTASAMLSVDAFDLAGDKTQYPKQLKYTEVWQPKRLFFNTSWWFYGSRERFEKETKDNPKFISMDVGVYYPLKGLSNNEIASMASSQHLCQGFGRLTTRGGQMEYVEFLKGEEPKDKEDIFAGINTTWNRVKGGGEIGDILYEIEKNFDFSNPSKHVPELVRAYALIQLLNDDYWRELKLKEITDIIEASLGLYMEASATSSSAVPNSEVQLELEVINRSDITTFFDSYRIDIDPKTTFVQDADTQLENNKKALFKTKFNIRDLPTSDPYWLKKDWSLGMYNVSDQMLIGNPETRRPLQVEFVMDIWEQKVIFTKDVVRRYSERDKGELYDPFEILPRATTKIKEKVMLFPDNASKTVSVAVRSGANNIKGTLSLDLPDGWSVEPKFKEITIEQKGDEQWHEFTVTPSSKESQGKVKALFMINGKKYDKELIEINYNHIPKQSVLLKSEAKVVRLNIEKAGNYIGYIKGAGDAVPESLEQIGYKVKIINPEEINEENLKQFDAIVLGIRAYNTVPALKYKQKFLLDYIENGGNMVVQYNTNRRVSVAPPYALKLSRDRVTDENAKVTVLAKNHSVVNFPNQITEKDFEGWVQERGLYFPNSWSSEYTAILSMSDKGESPKTGSLLVTKYGKGNYIYTGLSFFRELPAGVPGAYKLFANILSIGKENIKQDNKIKQ